MYKCKLCVHQGEEELERRFASPNLINELIHPSFSPAQIYENVKHVGGKQKHL